MQKYFCILLIIILGTNCNTIRRKNYLNNKDLSPEIRSAIINNVVIAGMSKNEVVYSIGWYDYYIDENEWKYIYYGYHIKFENNIVTEIIKRDNKIIEAIHNYSVIPSMTKEEVEYVLGAPESESLEQRVNDLYTYWLYHVKSSPSWKVTFKNGSVISIIDQNLGVYSYTQTFSNPTQESYVSGSRQDEIEQARREYNQALEEYENAKASYDSTVGFTRLSDFSLRGNKFAPLGHLANNINRDEARRKVEIAKERLESAKIRLLVLESKSDY